MSSPEKSLSSNERLEATETNEDEKESLEAIRVRLRHQERPAFFDETVLDQDFGDVRREPNSTEREEMNEKLIKLGSLFEGSGVRWQLDGALNISLMKGDFIGVHKDVDLTIDPDDLEKFEQELFTKGYGLFLSSRHEDPNKRKMEWVSADEFRSAPDDHLMICTIDEQGQIRKDEPFNFLDVHLIKRDANGRPLGFYDVPLPEEWYEPQTVLFHGKNINLSHPAKVAYFKLHGKRGFDQTDLFALAQTGKLTLDDVAEIESVFEKEFENRKATASGVIERVAPFITSESKQDDIYEILMQDKDVKGKIKKEEDKLRVRQLVELIAKLSDRSFENIQRVAFDSMGLDAKISDQHKKLEALRSRVRDIGRSKTIKVLL